MCELIGIEKGKKRTVGRQTTRDNHPSTSTSDYCKKAVTIPLLDHLITEMCTRFQPNAPNAYNGLYVIPSKTISLVSNNQVNWKEKFKSFTLFYQDDLPNPLALDAEIQIWERLWLDVKGTRPETLAQTLKSIDLKVFENLNVASRILATIPVTTCECERSFPALRKLKDYTLTKQTVFHHRQVNVCCSVRIVFVVSKKKKNWLMCQTGLLT